MSTFAFINIITTAMLLGFLFLFPKSAKPLGIFFLTIAIVALLLAAMIAWIRGI
jgi:hypothetical protein